MLAVNAIMWTKLCERGILQHEEYDLKKLSVQLEKEKLDIVKLIRGKLTKTKRKIISALITLDVHGEDVVQELLKHNVDTTEAFDWIS